MTWLPQNNYSKKDEETTRALCRANKEGKQKKPTYKQYAKLKVNIACNQIIARDIEKPKIMVGKVTYLVGNKPNLPCNYNIGQMEGRDIGVFIRKLIS